MDSIDNLRKGMGEIDILLKYAARNEKSKDINKYQLFNKMAITLLATKLEVFIEEFIEEHTDKQLQYHTNQTFPKELKEKYFDRCIELITEKKQRDKKDSLFQLLVTLYDGDRAGITKVKKIRPSTKFSYGKHGQTEIVSLFERHGLGKFIKSEEAHNCLKMMDSMVAIRNNVIHQDAVPSSLTHGDVKKHKANVLEFVGYIEVDLEANKQSYYNQI